MGEDIITVAHWDAAIQMLARTPMLIAIGFYFCSVVPVNVQWLVLQQSSSVNQMCRTVRWEGFA